jgi:hypothetical protein
MAQKKSSGGGRGSKEAIEKRRAARQLNAVLANGSKASNQLDGRTENRRRRLITELKEGRRGQPLKPIDYLSHVNELLGLGETLSSLKKQGVKPRKSDLSEPALAVVRQTQAAYDFYPEAWRMLGVPTSTFKRSAVATQRKTSKKKATRSRQRR